MGTDNTHAVRPSLAIVASLILLVLLVLFGWWLNQRRENSVPPQAVVEHLISLPHGLQMMGAKDQSLLERIRKSPDRYMPIIREQVMLKPDLIRYVELDTQRRFSGSTELMFAIGGEEALNLATELQTQVHDYLALEWKSVRAFERGERKRIAPLAQYMLRVARSLFDGFRIVRSDKAVGAAIEMIRIADYATAMSALQYLLAVASGDPEVAQAAAKAASDPGSSLTGDPVATAMIKALRHAPQKEKE